MILGFVFALLVAVLQQGDSAGSQTAMQQRAKELYERHKQSAIRINELAGRIQSEADASAVVSEIAGLFAKELPPDWASGSIRQRVAHAEYEAARNPGKPYPRAADCRCLEPIREGDRSARRSDCLSRRDS